MNGDPRTTNGLRWSFQWKEFVVNHKGVKPSNEVINIGTEFLTSEGGEQGYPIFFQKHQI